MLYMDIFYTINFDMFNKLCTQTKISIKKKRKEDSRHITKFPFSFFAFAFSYMYIYTFLLLNFWDNYLQIHYILKYKKLITDFNTLRQTYNCTIVNVNEKFQKPEKYHSLYISQINIQKRFINIQQEQLKLHWMR